MAKTVSELKEQVERLVGNGQIRSSLRGYGEDVAGAIVTLVGLGLQSRKANVELSYELEFGTK